MTETAQTVKEVVDTVIPYLQQAADKLGTTAAYLWQLQVRQAYVEGITYVIQIILLIGAWYLLYKGTKWLSVTPEDRSYPRWEIYEPLPFIVYFISVGLMGVLTCVMVCKVKLITTILLNPEYWALNQVILLLKGSINL